MAAQGGGLRASSDNSRPDLSTAVSIWSTARAWVDGGTTDPKQEMPPSSVRGAAIILRLYGRVVGIGIDWMGGPLMPTRAMQAALKDAVTDEEVARLREANPNDWGERLTLELELCGEPVPLLGRTFSDIIERINPGTDAIVMRRGEKFAYAFPCVMHTTNSTSDVAGAIARLCDQLDLPRRDLAQLEAIDSVAVYLAPTIRLAQSAPAQAPFRARRGHQVALPIKPTAEARAQFAGEIAQWLLRQIPKSESMRDQESVNTLGIPGAYRPATDSFEPLSASPAEQAVVALALARHAASLQNESEARSKELAASWRLLAALGDVDPAAERDPLQDALACSIAQLTMESLANSEAIAATQIAQPIRTKAEVFVSKALQSLKVDRACPDITLRAAVLAAVAPFPGQRDELDHVWESGTTEQLISALPFLMEAERRMAIAAPSSESETSSPAITPLPIAVQRAREARELLAQLQCHSSDTSSPEPDALGSFLLSASGRSHSGAQSSRPGAGLALMLRNPRFTSTEERIGAVVMQESLLRFLRQLQCDSASAYALRNSRQALGGIHTSLWDLNMPIGANGMTLWCVTESNESLRELDKARSILGR